MKLLLLKALILLAALAVSSCATKSETTDHHELRLQSNVVAIVSEGPLEPRSLGSYSLRIYQILDPKYPYDNYVAGMLVPRDGSIEALKAKDINGDGVEEIIVITRVAGSGSYISAVAYEYNGEKLNVIASVNDLMPDIDPIESLLSAYNETSSSNEPPVSQDQ